MIQIGSLDRITAIIGERGMGKSTLAKYDARQFQKETGGYVIGHSPNGQIGMEPDIKFYDRIDGFFGLARGLRRYPESMHFLANGPAESILDYGESLSRSVRKASHQVAGHRFAEHRPAPKGLKAPPTLIVIDEGTSMRRHPTNEEVERLERLLVNARHKHVALTWSIQSPTRRQWILMEQANRFRIFRYTHMYGANSLMSAGVPKELAYKAESGGGKWLGELGKFEFYWLDKEGRKSGFAKLPKPPNSH